MTGRARRRLSLFVGAACLAGCAGPPAPPPAATKIRVSYVPYLSHAPFFVGVEEGFFREQGLDVELIQLHTTKGGIAALAAGELDAAGAYQSAALYNAMHRGARIQIVADRVHAPVEDGCSPQVFVGRSDLLRSGRLRELHQLEGLRIAMTAGSIEEYYVERLLRQAGLTTTDVVMLNLPARVDFDALRKGLIDVTLTGEPDSTRLTTAGVGELWMPVHRIAPGFQQGFLLYGPTLLDRDPEAGRRFMVAYLKAVQQLNEGKTERNVAILARYTELPEDLLRRACWALVRADGRINTASLRDFQEWALAKGLLDAVVPEQEAWNPTFAEHAQRALAASGGAER